MARKPKMVEATAEDFTPGTRSETPQQRRMREYLEQATRVARAQVRDPRTTSVVKPKDPLACFGKFNRPGDERFSGQGKRERQRRLWQGRHQTPEAK
jgi:hypothetical protein